MFVAVVGHGLVSKPQPAGFPQGTKCRQEPGVAISRIDPTANIFCRFSTTRP